MALSARTERAVEACYDAVLVPALWPAALQQLADSLGVASCTFGTSDPSALTVPISSEHKEFADLWLRNESHAPCPYTRRAGCCRAGHPYIIDDQIVTAEERKTLAYFHETASPGNREWWAGASFSVADRRWCLSLYRDAARGRFTHDEGRYFAKVAPHLGRVVASAERFTEVRVVSALSALEHLKCAALVINSRGVARHLNRLAENLLGDDFSLHFGRPATRDPASNRRLQQLISSILVAERGCVPALNQVVIDRAETPWLLLETMPVTALGSDVFGEGRTVLMLTDLTGSAAADSRLLAVVFGLTAAEAKLAACIGSGSGIDASAAALGIGRETARSQLKAVFLKTNTRAQAELIALISRLRPVIRQ